MTEPVLKIVVPIPIESFLGDYAPSAVLVEDVATGMCHISDYVTYAIAYGHFVTSGLDSRSA